MLSDDGRTGSQRGGGIHSYKRTKSSLRHPFMRTLLTPADFRRGQTDVLAQASRVEEFLRDKQDAGRQQQARTAWLVAQQRLEQEEADCEASLAAWLKGGGCTAGLLQSSVSSSKDAHSGGSAGTEEAPLLGVDISGSIANAVAAAAAVTSLLAGPASSSSPLLLQEVKQQLQTAAQALQGQLKATDATISRQLSAAQCQFAEACRVPDGGVPTSLHERLRLLCSRHPLAAPECKAQVLAQAAEAEAHHTQQLGGFKAAWHAFEASTRQHQPLGSASSSASDMLAGDGSDGLALQGTCDGWAGDEQAVFLRERCACFAPGGGGQPALLRQMAALLPGRTQQQVQAHLLWHKEEARLRCAVVQLEAGWQQELAAMEAAAAELMAESEAGCFVAAEALLLQLEAAANRLLLANAADQQRVARAGWEAAEVERRLSVATVMAIKQAAQRHAAADHRSRMKQLLSAHRHDLQEQAAAAAAEQQVAMAAAVKEAAAAAAAGRQRAQYRQQLMAQKAACYQRQAAQREQENRRQEEELEELRRQVAPAASRDAARAMGATESSAAAAAVVGQQHGVFASALGFTTDQVLADQRFKVYEALRALALHATPAGRQAFAAARPAGALRTDMLTSDQRRGMV